MPRPYHPSGSGYVTYNNPITIESDSDSASSSHADSAPATSVQRPGQQFQQPHRSLKRSAAASNQKTRMCNHAREVRHTAHCVLASRELLMLHALASNESVPRTRRRFLAQIIEPDNPKAAIDIAFDRKSGATTSKSIQRRGETHASIGAIQGGVTPGNVIDVTETDDSKGWELGIRRRASNVASSSPARESPGSPARKRGKGKGRTPDPERLGGGGGGGASPSPSTRDRRERERERRRRWSGAERERGLRISSMTAAEVVDTEAINMDVDGDLDMGSTN